MPLLEQVLDKYPKDVKLIYKSFPIANHKYARQAAATALAAWKQGKFWQVHDLFFKNFNKLNDTEIRKIAQGLKLDMKKLDRDIKSNEIQSMIDRDIQEGQRHGVRGTPTIFINGKLLQQRSLAGFSALIDKELGKK